MPCLSLAVPNGDGVGQKIYVVPCSDLISQALIVVFSARTIANRAFCHSGFIAEVWAKAPDNST